MRLQAVFFAFSKVMQPCPKNKMGGLKPMPAGEKYRQAWNIQVREFREKN